VDKCNAAQNSSDNVPLILQSPLLRIMPTGSGGQKPYKAMLTDKKACTHAVSVEQAFLAVFTHFLGFKEHTHTQPFNGHLSRTTRVSRYQKKHSPTHTHDEEGFAETTEPVRVVKPY